MAHGVERKALHGVAFLLLILDSIDDNCNKWAVQGI